MWPFKNKYDKMKREDVVNSICELEKQGEDLETAIVEKNEQIASLMNKGRSEPSRELKLLYAKKINHLKEEREQDVKRSMYIMYNIKLMNRLKTALDDKDFIVKTGKVSLNNLLADQRGLAKFLNKTLKIKMDSEDSLVSADTLFKELDETYVENAGIYSPNTNDDGLLAMFETDEQLDMEDEMYALSGKENPNKIKQSLSEQE